MGGKPTSWTGAACENTSQPDGLTRQVATQPVVCRSRNGSTGQQQYSLQIMKEYTNKDKCDKQFITLKCI